MPTRDEILKQLADGYQEILDRLDRIEQAQGADDEWLQDFDLAGTDEPEQPTVPAPERPKDWAAYTPAQQEAWLRLNTAEAGRTDLGARPQVEMEEIIIAGGVGVEFPAPPESIKAEWAGAAAEVMAGFVPDQDKGTLIGKKDAVAAYAAGGPLWLAAFDHEYLMGLPDGWRGEMVQQVTEYAPVQGKLLGRDILRVSAERQQSRADKVAEEMYDRPDQFKGSEDNS